MQLLLNFDERHAKSHNLSSHPIWGSTWGWRSDEKSSETGKSNKIRQNRSEFGEPLHPGVVSLLRAEVHRNLAVSRHLPSVYQQASDALLITQRWVLPPAECDWLVTACSTRPMNDSPTPTTTTTTATNSACNSYCIQVTTIQTFLFSGIFNIPCNLLQNFYLLL